MIAYDEPLYRPPSEAWSFILQATIGCSFNRCSFCSMYRSKDYRARPFAELSAEIDHVARSEPETRKVFLADGDAFGLPTDDLLRILEKLDSAFPELGRVGAYAWPMNVYRKTDAELERLAQAKLKIVYVGMESGADRLLKKITKGANADLTGAATDRLRKAGLRVSATMILGLGGRVHWREHVEGTIVLVSKSPPNFLSTLQLGLAPEIEDEFHRKFKEPFEPQDDFGLLGELELLLQGVEPKRGIIFRSNHASNALALAGNLPRDRERLLSEVQQALRGERALRPPGWRSY